MKYTSTYLAVIAFGLALPTFAAGPQGKEVFEKICSECHGERGSGNQVANNFYKVQIPRLDSAQVQSMSDEDLKTVIVKGRRKMKPPLAGTPYMQHKVKPELLNDVVAYVRTLKKAS
jgi:mono/diheme cytochrome c family protein